MTGAADAIALSVSRFSVTARTIDAMTVVTADTMNAETGAIVTPDIGDNSDGAA